MKKQKNIRIFDVAFNQNIMKEVIQYYVDTIDPEKMSQEEISKTLEYAMQMVFGRIIFEATPRLMESLKHNVKGYRLIIEAINDKDSKMLDIEFNEGGSAENLMNIDKKEILKEKDNRKISKKLNEL